MKLRWSQVLAIALSGTLPTGIAAAQDYPAREIHSVVNFPPGSGMDIMIRYYSVKLQQLAGKPVVVENKPGATGNIATEYVARSKPDGYTFMITPASSTLAAAHRSVQETAVRPRQGSAARHAAGEAWVRVCCSWGLSGPHDERADRGAQEQARTWRLRKRRQHRHRCFRDIQGREPDSTPTRSCTRAPSTCCKTWSEGKSTSPRSIRARSRNISRLARCALSPSRQRHASGRCPTFRPCKKSGFPDFDLTPWIGLVVPAGTPQPIVQKLADWHRQINAMEETKKILLQFGMDPLEGDADGHGRAAQE